MSTSSVAGRLVDLLGLPDEYGRPGLRADVIAGLSLVVVLIPQAMAFSALVGVPPVAGLYAALVSLVAYALLGSSSQLSFGPIAIVSLLSGAAVAPLAGGDVRRALALVALLAGMVGIIHTAVYGTYRGTLRFFMKAVTFGTLFSDDIIKFIGNRCLLFGCTYNRSVF